MKQLFFISTSKDIEQAIGDLMVLTLRFDTYEEAEKVKKEWESHSDLTYTICSCTVEFISKPK